MDAKGSLTREKENKEGSFRKYKVRPVWTERDGTFKDGFNYTSNLCSDSNSKISSYMNINPLLTDEKSTFRNITARSNNLTNKKEYT
jgi:hypothetical protein